MGRRRYPRHRHHEQYRPRQLHRHDGQRSCQTGQYTVWGTHLWRGQNNTIGGANVISGNGQDGVRIAGANTAGNVVAGNLIGTSYSGLVLWQ